MVASRLDDPYTRGALSYLTTPTGKAVVTNLREDGTFDEMLMGFAPGQEPSDGNVQTLIWALAERVQDRAEVERLISDIDQAIEILQVSPITASSGAARPILERVWRTTKSGKLHGRLKMLLWPENWPPATAGHALAWARLARNVAQTLHKMLL